MDNIQPVADLYWEKRLVAWIAHYCDRGNTLEQILAINAKNKRQFKEKDIRRLYQTGCQATQNANNIQYVMDMIRLARKNGTPLPPEANQRLCDLKGCKFPERVK